MLELLLPAINPEKPLQNVIWSLTTQGDRGFFPIGTRELGHHGLTDGQTKEYRDVNDLSGHAVIQWSNHVHDY